MTAPRTNTRRVLVVERDARVRSALTAIINATPGLQVVAALTSATDVDSAIRACDATIAVVGVGVADADQDLSVVRQLSTRLPVVAISAATCDGARAVEAGATTFCDEDGNADCLTAAVAAAARRHGPARVTSQESVDSVIRQAIPPGCCPERHDYEEA